MSKQRYVDIDDVVYHLDDIEVDKDGKCDWTDVANALTHIKLCIEPPGAECSEVRTETPPAPEYTAALVARLRNTDLIDDFARLDAADLIERLSRAAQTSAVQSEEQNRPTLEHRIRAETRIPLIKIAAECHRRKWQFSTDDEVRLPAAEARQLVKKAFDVLHSIGDMAHKAAENLRSANGSDAAAAQASKEPAAYLRDEVRDDDSINTEVCDKGDPGAYPVYRSSLALPSASRGTGA